MIYLHDMKNLFTKLKPKKLSKTTAVKKKKYFITFVILLILAVVAVTGRRSPFGNKWEGFIPDSSIFDNLSSGNQEGNKYTNFFFEIYDLIKNKHWNKLSDEQLNTIAKLGIEKLTNDQLITVPLTKEDLNKVIVEQMSNMNDEEKKDFISKLSDLVLANLEPFGRSRLYTTKKKEELSNTVKNINPNINHYETLEIDENSTDQDIKLAYDNKLVQLKNQEQTPEVKQKIKAVETAFTVLNDIGAKEVYDEKGVDPTLDYRLITPRIFYFHIKKFSPTTVQELQRVTEGVDEGNELDTLIIDLRGNIGGAIDGLPYFLGPFIGQNQYAYQFFSRGEKKDFITKTGWLPSLVRYKKVIVLIDGNAQSSAEVFAAVIKKYNVGIVVGETTKGWGTVESVFKINNQPDPENEEYSVFLVHSLTLREDSVPIEGKGVDPTIDISNPNWENELFKYFHYQELVNVVRDLVNTPVN